MQSRYYAAAMLLLMAISTIFFVSCDKETPIVEEDLNGFDAQTVQPIIDPSGVVHEYIEMPMSPTLVHHYNPAKTGDLVNTEVIDGTTHKYFDRRPSREEIKAQYHPYKRDGKIFISESAMEAYSDAKKKRSVYYDVRFDPNGHLNDHWLLWTWNTGMGKWQHVAWLDNVTVTVGLPYGDDDCTGDRIVFRLTLYGWTGDCEEMKVKYYKNSSVYATYSAVAHDIFDNPGKHYYIRVKNGVQPSSPAVATIGNDCLSTTTHYDCEN